MIEGLCGFEMINESMLYNRYIRNHGSQYCVTIVVPMNLFLLLPPAQDMQNRTMEERFIPPHKASALREPRLSNRIPY